MRITVAHETRYTYDGPARAILQLLRLTPRDHDGQHVIRWRIEPSVEGRLRAGEDGLGNIVHSFAADEPTTDLRIRVLGEVEMNDSAGLVRGTIERVPDAYFLRDTDLTTADDALRSLAERVAGETEDALSRLHALLGAVHEEVRFDIAPTDAQTTAAQAYEMKRGVCQDLTHIFVSVARHLGIPARYVSGYFLRADGVVEQEAGHAWAEAMAPDLGWIGFDPANGISVTAAHIRVAVGLDYHAAAPIRGSRRGGGTETMAVNVRVEQAPRGGQSQSQSQSQGGSQSQSQRQG